MLFMPLLGHLVVASDAPWQLRGGSMKLFHALFSQGTAIPAAPWKSVSQSWTRDRRILIMGTRRVATDEESLRVAAIRKLPDGEALRRLAGLSGPSRWAIQPLFPAAVETGRAERVPRSSLMKGQSISPGSAITCGTGRNYFPWPALCKDIPLGCHRRLPRSMIRCKSSRLVVEGSSSRLRQLAAEVVEDPAQLRELLKQVRNKDKTVYKILKEKCEALKRRGAQGVGVCERSQRALRVARAAQPSDP